MYKEKTTMIYSVRCKHCGKVQSFRSNALEGEFYYKCTNCDKFMTERESSKFSNLETLDNFEIVAILESNTKNEQNTNLFLRTVFDIEDLFHSADNATQEKIINFLETSYIILNRKNKNDSSVLFETVENLRSTICYKRQAKMKKLLGLSDEFEDLIQYIEDKLQGYRINDYGRTFIENLYKKYDFDFLIECIDISADSYLTFDDDDNLDKKNVEIFLDKIGGIAYNKSMEEKGKIY